MNEIEMDWPGTARINAEEFYLEPEVAALLRGLADEIDRLREALEVFAGPPDFDEPDDDVPHNSPVVIKCHLGDVRRARAALPH